MTVFTEIVPALGSHGGKRSRRTRPTKKTRTRTRTKGR